MKKIFPLGLVVFFLFAHAQNLQASPWAENQGYFSKTGGKLAYGLKNVAFGWMMMFAESKMPQYHREWEGFCVGISRSVIYTANGLIHIATFPIPVDFPDVGRGVYIPKEEPPSKKKGIPTPPKTSPTIEKEVQAERIPATEPAAASARKPLTVESPLAPAKVENKEPVQTALPKPISKTQASEVIPKKVAEQPVLPKPPVSVRPAPPASVYVPSAAVRPVPQGYVPNAAQKNPALRPVSAAAGKASKTEPQQTPEKKSAGSLEEYHQRFALRDELYTDTPAEPGDQQPATVRTKADLPDTDKSDDLEAILEEAGKFSEPQKN